jgi:hypothetical protein
LLTDRASNNPLITKLRAVQPIEAIARFFNRRPRQWPGMGHAAAKPTAGVSELSAVAGTDRKVNPKRAGTRVIRLSALRGVSQVRGAVKVDLVVLHTDKT